MTNTFFYSHILFCLSKDFEDEILIFVAYFKLNCVVFSMDRIKNQEFYLRSFKSNFHLKYLFNHNKSVNVSINENMNLSFADIKTADWVPVIGRSIQCQGGGSINSHSLWQSERRVWIPIFLQFIILLLSHETFTSIFTYSRVRNRRRTGNKLRAWKIWQKE